MAKKCESYDEAFEEARKLKADPEAIKPAALTILTHDGATEYWAVANPDDADTVPGFIEGITLV